VSVKVRERIDKKTGKVKGWYVLTDWNGQRKAKFFGKDKRQAKAFADKLEARLKWAEQSGEPIVLSQPDQAMPTVKSYLEDWLNTYAKVHCKPSTYRGYKRAIEEQLLPAFGEHQLHMLKREHVKRFVAKKADELVSRAKKPKTPCAWPSSGNKRANVLTRRCVMETILTPLVWPLRANEKSGPAIV